MSLHFDERVHGGFLGQQADFLDLSTNLNPYGPCEVVLNAARGANLERYPDATALTARRAWAQRLGRSPADISVGHGAADLLWAIARARLRPGQRVVIAGPTFSELAFAARACGACVEQISLFDSQDASVGLDRLEQAARGAALVYLCSPNNPTGHYVPPAALASLAQRMDDGWLVVDQAFLSLSDHAHDLSARLGSNVICVRSLTKDFALAGLRIGYLVAEPDLVAQIERCRPTWSTSEAALRAIEAAALEAGFVAERYARLVHDRRVLERGLRALGLDPWPSSTVFLLVPVGDAARITTLLRTRGVGVRDASSFGLPRHVRVAVRPRAQTERLLDAFRSIRAVGGAAIPAL